MPLETGKLEAEVKEAASSLEAPVPVVDDNLVRPRMDPTARRYDDAPLSMYLTEAQRNLSPAMFEEEANRDEKRKQ
jgi:hypothetical protein